MKGAIIGLSLLLPLFACGRTAFAPVEVKIPIRAKCEIEEVKKPDYNLPKTPVEAPLFDKVKAALADIELYRGYIAELEAATKACSGS